MTIDLRDRRARFYIGGEEMAEIVRFHPCLSTHVAV